MDKYSNIVYSVTVFCFVFISFFLDFFYDFLQVLYCSLTQIVFFLARFRQQNLAAASTKLRQWTETQDLGAQSPTTSRYYLSVGK